MSGLCEEDHAVPTCVYCGRELQSGRRQILCSGCRDIRSRLKQAMEDLEKAKQSISSKEVTIVQLLGLLEQLGLNEFDVLRHLGGEGGLHRQLPERPEGTAAASE